MNEMKDTKCPLCGAPAVVHITDEPHFVGSDNKPTRVSYEYDEPSPPPWPTLRGYEIPHLVAVAELIHRHGMTPEDLHDLKSNFERAFSLAAEIMKRDMQSQIEAFQAGLKAPLPFKISEDGKSVQILRKEGET